MILAKIIKKIISKMFWEGKPTGKHLHSTNGDPHCKDTTLPKAGCVCVWNVWTDAKLCGFIILYHTILYYIILYYILYNAGGNRGPGGVGGQRRHPPGPVKTYLLAVALDGNPLSGGCSWALQWQSLGAVVRSGDVTIYIYICVYIYIYKYT